MRKRRARFEALGTIVHRRQRLVIDVAPVRGVFGDIAAVRDHEGDRLADVAHFVLGEAIRHERLLDRRVRHQQRQRLPLHDSGRSAWVKHRMHARQSERRALVDAPMPAWACGLRTTAACSMPGKRDVVDEAASPRQERGVFLALDARAEPLRAHQPRPFAACKPRARSTARSSAR